MPTYPTCSFILTRGTLCQSPALKDSTLCYYHGRDRQRKENLQQARDLKNSDHFYRWPIQQENLNPEILESLDIPALDDGASIQVAVTNIVRAICSGHISDKKAGLALFGLQIATINLPKVRLRISDNEPVAQEDTQPIYDFVEVPLPPAGHAEDEKARRAAQKAAERRIAADVAAAFGSRSDSPKEMFSETFDVRSETDSVVAREDRGLVLIETRNSQIETAPQETGNEKPEDLPHSEQHDSGAKSGSAERPEALLRETENQKPETVSRAMTAAQRIRLADALHKGKLAAIEFLKEQKQQQSNTPLNSSEVSP